MSLVTNANDFISWIAVSTASALKKVAPAVKTVAKVALAATVAMAAADQTQPTTGTAAEGVVLYNPLNSNWNPALLPDFGRRKPEHCADIQARGIKIYEYKDGHTKDLIFSKSDRLEYKLHTDAVNKILQRNSMILSRSSHCFYASAFLYHYTPGSDVIGFYGDVSNDHRPPSMYPNLNGEHHQFRFMNPAKEEYLILDPTISPTQEGHNSILIIESTKADLDDTYRCVFGTNYSKMRPRDAKLEYSEYSQQANPLDIDNFDPSRWFIEKLYDVLEIPYLFKETNGLCAAP